MLLMIPFCIFLCLFSSFSLHFYSHFPLFLPSSFQNNALKASESLAQISSLARSVPATSPSALVSTLGFLFVSYGMFHWIDDNIAPQFVADDLASSPSSTTSSASLGLLPPSPSLSSTTASDWDRRSSLGRGSVRSNSSSIARVNATYARVTPHATSGRIMLHRQTLVEIVDEILDKTGIVSKKWAPMSGIHSLLKAVKLMLLEKSDRASALLEESAKGVPDNCRFLKTMMLVRSLAYHRKPSGRKEREKVEKRVVDLRGYLTLAGDLKTEMIRLEQATRHLFE